jgi:predicted esterase
VTAAWSDALDLDTEGRLTDEGRRIVAALATTCPWEVGAPVAVPFIGELADWPAWEPLLEANSPGHGRSDAPILVLAASDDDVIPPASIAPGLDRLRAAGSDVELRWVDGGHAATLEAPEGAAAAFEWVTRHLPA